MSARKILTGRSYASGLYNQIEIYYNPDFYTKILSKIISAENIESGHPYSGVDWIPKIIEIKTGWLPALEILIGLWDDEKVKPIVDIRPQGSIPIRLSEESKDIIRNLDGNAH